MRSDVAKDELRPRRGHGDCVAQIALDGIKPGRPLSIRRLFIGLDKPEQGDDRVGPVEKAFALDGGLARGR